MSCKKTQLGSITNINVLPNSINFFVLKRECVSAYLHIICIHFFVVLCEIVSWLCISSKFWHIFVFYIHKNWLITYYFYSFLHYNLDKSFSNNIFLQMSSTSWNKHTVLFQNETFRISISARKVIKSHAVNESNPRLTLSTLSFRWPSVDEMI